MKNLSNKLFSRGVGKLLLMVPLAVVSLIAYNNCSGFNSYPKGSIEASSVSGAAQLQMGLKVKDSTGKVIYDDSLPNQSLTLKAGQSYTFDVTSQSSVTSGAALSLKITDISTIGAQPMVLNLNFGSNFIASNLLQQGDYALDFNASVGNTVLAKSYTAAVSCANPTFTAASLNASAISVSSNSSGSNNLFDYSVSGVVSGADGMGPYDCAIDPTGTAILDTGFQPCSQTFSKIYSNYVSQRNVGVIVRDSCNITHSVSKQVNLPYAEPALGAGNVFIYGQTSNGTGAARGDKRVDAVTYLATNQNPHNIVQSNYNNRGGFTIQSAQNYQMASSVNFGVKIVLTGLRGSVDPSKMTGSVDASAATISSVAYSTDESGGMQVALSFSGAACTLTNQQAQVKFVAGVPCSNGTTGDQNAAKVEVWGHYKCSALSNSAGAVDFEGDFDGLDLMQDSCIGGGGGGGGGVVPVKL